jgi:membrane-associated protease RseP (regulator of RpoE activity)
MTRFARGLLVALALAGCDQGAKAEIVELREGLAAQTTIIGELRARLDRVEADLAAARDERSRVPSILPSEPGAAVGSPALSATCSAGRCTIARADFEGLMADPSALVKAARVLPNIKDGVHTGFKLFGIRPSSPFAAIGLQNGDIVTEIGGKPMNSIEAALAAHAELSMRKEWTIKGERRGAPFEVTVAVGE